MLDRYLSEKLGFQKLGENMYGAVYQRWNPKFRYMQIIYICHKESGHHLIQSYDRDLMDEKKIGNTAVGIEIKEMLPLWLKAKWMAHKYHWNRRKKA